MSSKSGNTTRSLFVLLVLVLSATAANGQSGCADSDKVICVIPNLFGVGATGITLANPTHAAHFEDSTKFTTNFLPLNTAVASQLALLPLPSPASGFTYELDKATGLRSSRAQTLGPILAERGETLGVRRAFVGFSYQRFDFTKIDGIDIDHLPLVFTHQPNVGGIVNPGGNFEGDVITADTGVDLKINQFIFSGSFGVTDRTDVSVALPIMNVNLKGSSNATIQRLSGATCVVSGATVPCHFFDLNNPQGSTTNTYARDASATGIGDITVRVKQNVYNSSSFSVAILGDVRLPTGDEEDFLGAGAAGFKPFVAMSWKTEHFSPHVNIGYQWNGSSVLTGDVLKGTEEKLPNQFIYAFGTEYKATRDVTISADLIGQRVFDSTNVSTSEFVAATGAKFPTLSFTNKSFGINNASIGLKYGLKDKFQFTFNGLISVDDSGARQRFTPLFGFSLLL